MMTSRDHLQDDWDPMAEDFNDTYYDSQHQGDESQMVTLDHTRLYITNMPKTLNEEGLQTTLGKYGTLTECYYSKDPLKRYGLVSFETAGEAKLAMAKLNRAEPLKLCISIAHKKTKRERHMNTQHRDRHYNREETSSVVSRGMSNKSAVNGDNNMNNVVEEETFVETMDPDLNLELEQLKLEHLKLQEAQLLCKQRLLLKQAEKKASIQSSATNRSFLPDGRIIVRNSSINERAGNRDGDVSHVGSSADLNETNTICSCKAKGKNSWDQPSTSDEGSSTPSTCVMCSEDSCKSDKIQTDIPDHKDKSDLASTFTKHIRDNLIKTHSKTTDISRRSFASNSTNITNIYTNTEATSKRSGAVNKKLDVMNEKNVEKNKSDMTCDLKYSDLYSDSEDADETNRLIQLRNSDYLDIVEDTLKIVIALAGYPKSKMGLRQMEKFQRCMAEIMDMQLKENLLKKLPTFLDYYLNRGAIVCVCKDLHSRDWLVRICAGLQERMESSLILLKAKVKRLCWAALKIPLCCWPATAQDAFKLLQYFNPTLKTNLWKIYAQKTVDNVECTSFLIDKVSGEIIRGPSFKNVIDYSQMEFELTGYTEIYYECFLSSSDEDLSSVASRVKLLDELKTEESSLRNKSEVSSPQLSSPVKEISKEFRKLEYVAENKNKDLINVLANDSKHKERESGPKVEDTKKWSDACRENDKNDELIWSEDEYNDKFAKETSNKNDKTACTSFLAVSDKSDSVIESNDLTISRTSNLNIESNRGIAYYRRTNYLHVENELKISITLDGYPQNKLDGTHIRRLKHLFKEYLHKDMKQQRFTNLIIPKFQDVYLSNGAVIYICDSLESKDYLIEILPKFINSTGLKLMFRDIQNLVRYTRVVMRLPKEKAQIESAEILQNFQEKYPKLRPDCWKYYSDVAGKQKRQFGVDPESLEVIKKSEFDPVYEGVKIHFRIIDRQKRDFEEREIKSDSDEEESKKKSIKDNIVKQMYIPIELMNISLTKIRIAHYCDVVADDFKLYVGPANYPESRIDECLFHSIKRTFENIVCESFERGDTASEFIPKFHDIYLFDGVIFVICQNIESRLWIEQVLTTVNNTLDSNLKCTEFRGAVGIVTLSVKTNKDTKDVINTLQKQNPRLRTKFWRIISSVHLQNKLDVVLQIDKLSAQVISSRNFNKLIEGKPVQFKLGHLQSLLKRKLSLKDFDKTFANINIQTPSDYGSERKNYLKHKNEVLTEIETSDEIKNEENISDSEIPEKPARAPEMDSNLVATKPTSIFAAVTSKFSEIGSSNALSPKRNSEPTLLKYRTPPSNFKIILKIPPQLVPDDKEDLNILFDLLEDKNPGLNTELWEISTDSNYPNNGKVILIVDKQSASVIQSEEFDSTIVGKQLKFNF